MDQPSSAAPVRIDFEFLDRLEQDSGIQASLCYQCRKCSNGCPLTFAMDHYPDRIIRLLLLGRETEALHSRTIWVCSTCETCTTRCPNGIDIAGLMDHLKQEAYRRQIFGPKDNRSLAVHQSFLKDISKRGRVHETSFMNRYVLSSGAWQEKLRSGTLSEDIGLGWALLKRNRLPLLPEGVKDKEEIKALFRESDFS